jgi:hypothetical protein
MTWSHETRQSKRRNAGAGKSQKCRSTGAAGQSLVESCVVIGILCLLFMALFQLSQLYMGQEIVRYAAGRGARAKTVGFNEFMVYKTVRVGTIANAGKMLAPEVAEQTPSDLTLTLGTRFHTHFPVSITRGPAAQRALERSRIPLYLGASLPAYLPTILNYDEWSTINYSCIEQASPSLLDFTVYQSFPLKIALHRLFYSEDYIPFTGHSIIENHYPLYLNID